MVPFGVGCWVLGSGGFVAWSALEEQMP